MSSLCKCVIWDLDNTVWEGICLEGQVVPKPDILHTISTLHERGVLHSVASRGENDVAWNLLEAHELSGYFIVPKINWLPKSTNILSIARTLNLPLDAITFVDDDPFEREQVSYMLPGVKVLPPEDARQLCASDAFDAQPMTAEAKIRSRLYQEEQARAAAERTFANREDFLLSCSMELTVRSAAHGDVPRILELITRTHQMNSTGMAVHETALLHMIDDPEGGDQMYVAELRDRYGWCGIIGIAWSELREKESCVRLFAMSCRVMGRGIERAFLSSLIEDATQKGAERVVALFRETEKNRMMRTMYQMAGFRQHRVEEDGTLVFGLDFKQQATCPRWVKTL